MQVVLIFFVYIDRSSWERGVNISLRNIDSPHTNYTQDNSRLFFFQINK